MRMGLPSGSRTQIVRDPADDATVAALRDWRLSEARRRTIAPFVDLHDAAWRSRIGTGR
jgi:hypothetical protein